MFTLKFNEMDLVANRRGDLSVAQQYRLKNSLQSFSLQYRRSAFAVLIVIAVVMVVGMLLTGRNLGQLLSLQTVLAFIMVIGLFAFVMLASGIWGWWNLRRLTHSQVYCTEGVVEVVINRAMMSRMGRFEVYNLEVKPGAGSKKTFRFQDEESLRYFRKGEQWRVYYLSNSVVLLALSAEQNSLMTMNG